MPKNRSIDRPIVLGIVGDSAAGKTALTAGIAEILGPERVVTICTDDYHRFSRSERARLGLTALDPQANYVDILEQHICLLRSGQPILKPVYNHNGGFLDVPEYVEPREYVVVEGLLGYSTKGMRDCFDVKVYVEPREDLRVKWKIQRDTTERGYTEADVRRVLDRRSSDSASFIHPQRTFADIVVNFHPPQANSEEMGAHLNVCHALRPTLPHPDLSPIIDIGTKSGIRLDLSRDSDGKPVDVLQIRGDLDDDTAAGVEDLLWNLIPEAAHLRDNVGHFRNGSETDLVSHPLALSQLMVTYHVVKAALGHHAV